MRRRPPPRRRSESSRPRGPVVAAVGDGRDERHDELFRRYLEEIATLSPLAPEEELRLGRLARDGDHDAGEQLVRGNLQLVVAIARRYRAAGVPLLDLVQEGNIGLMEAVEAFDPDRGFSFRSYAMWWIRQAIAQAVEEHGAPTAVVPDDEARLQAAWDGFVARQRRQPTLAELAAEVGLAGDRVVGLLGLPPPISEPPAP